VMRELLQMRGLDLDLHEFLNETEFYSECDYYIYPATTKHPEFLDTFEKGLPISKEEFTHSWNMTIAPELAIDENDRKIIDQLRLGGAVGSGFLEVSLSGDICTKPSDELAIEKILRLAKPDFFLSHYPFGHILRDQLDDAFRDLSAGRCGMYYGDAISLRQLIGAFDRTGAYVKISGPWLSEDQVGRIRNEIATAAEKIKKQDDDERNRVEAENKKCDASSNCRSQRDAQRAHQANEDRSCVPAKREAAELYCAWGLFQMAGNPGANDMAAEARKAVSGCPAAANNQALSIGARATRTVLENASPQADVMNATIEACSRAVAQAIR
jgi:hypothetical protein